MVNYKEKITKKHKNIRTVRKKESQIKNDDAYLKPVRKAG